MMLRLPMTFITARYFKLSFAAQPCQHPSIYPSIPVLCKQRCAVSLWTRFFVQHTVLLIDWPIHRQGVPGADYHNAEVSESSSKMSQDLQNEKPATSDVKSVLPKFSEINLLHNDLVCAIPSIYFTSGYMYCCWRCIHESWHLLDNLSWLAYLSQGLPDDEKSAGTSVAKWS